MSDMAGIGDLVAQVKEASRNIAEGDARSAGRMDAIERSVNELFRKTSRPGPERRDSDDASFERKSAVKCAA